MSYVFDANTDPNERTRRRRLAEALMLKATDAGPIASPWQGAAKMAQALMSGIELGQYDKQDRLGQESAKADMEAAMNGGGVTARPQVPSPVAAALANPPSFTQTGGKMAQAPSDLAPYFDEASKMTGIPASVLMAKVQQESRFNPNAIGKAGEVGLAQIMPSTARDPGFGMQGVDPQSLRDPRTNILFGAQYLAARGKAAGVTDWNDRNQVAKALTAYNGGGDPNYAQHVMRFLPGQGAPSRVAGALAGGGGQPTMAGGDTLAPPAQAQPTQLPSAAPAAGLMGAGQDTSSQQAAILKALQNPYISPAQKQVLTLRYQSLQKDPKTALELEQLQLGNAEKRRTLSQTEMEYREDPATGNVYERPKGSPNTPWRVSIQVGQKPQNVTFGEVGIDPTTGQPVRGFIDPNTASVKEYKPTPDPKAPVLPPDAVPPPGVDPKAWREGYTKNQQAQGSAATPDEVAKLRSEVQGLPSYKNYAQAAPIYRSMFDSAGTDSKASDLNLVYGLGKIMDPGSVVREGEMVMVKNTAGLPEWFTGLVNGLNGGQALTPETRKAIMQEAYTRLQAYQSQFNQEADFYKKIATDRRANPAHIIPDYGQFTPWAPKAAAAPAANPVAAPKGVDPAIEAEMRRRGLLK